jgi:hypothetical protein
MLGSNIYLMHRVAEEYYREQLAEADRQRSVYIALDGQPRTRRTGISGALARLATLLRAQCRLMPPEALAGGQRPVAIGLRTGPWMQWEPQVGATPLPVTGHDELVGAGTARTDAPVGFPDLGIVLRLSDLDS